MEATLREYLARTLAFQREAHRILSRHEGSSSRVVILGETYKQLAALSLQQDDLLKQALRCIENELFRAAHVMAWAALMDLLEEKLAADGLARIRNERPKWRAGNLEELRDYQGEFQIIEAARDAGLISKTEMKALHGLLNKRNECAHPSDYFPGLNDSLGYIDELLKRIRALQARSL